VTEERLYTASMYGTAEAAVAAQRADALRRARDAAAARWPGRELIDVTSTDDAEPRFVPGLPAKPPPIYSSQLFVHVGGETKLVGEVHGVELSHTWCNIPSPLPLSTGFTVAVQLSKRAARQFEAVFFPWRSHRRLVRQMKLKLRGKNWRLAK
jgi:hypothetical protein